MDHLTSTSVSGNFSLNEPDHELLHQNIIGNSYSVSAAVVNNLNQHNEGKEIEQIVSSHYPGIPNLANFSESMTNSNTMRSSLEERIALQPRGLNRDIGTTTFLLMRLALL